jgi:hypothetical protein
MTRDTFDMFDDQERGRFGDNEVSLQSARPRVTGTSDLIDLTLCLHAESKGGQKEQGAIRVSSDGDDAKAQWLPKSQVEFSLTGKRQRSKQGPGVEIVTVTLPEWMAKEKGLI